MREGNPLSAAEAERQMEMTYNKVVKPLLKKGFNIYRTYKMSNVNLKGLRVLKLKEEALKRNI